jgi:hypothetical protein
VKRLALCLLLTACGAEPDPTPPPFCFQIDTVLTAAFPNIEAELQAATESWGAELEQGASDCQHQLVATDMPAGFARTDRPIGSHGYPVRLTININVNRLSQFVQADEPCAAPSIRLGYTLRHELGHAFGIQEHFGEGAMREFTPACEVIEPASEERALAFP